MDDLRKGLPSASSLGRIIKCPGSVAMIDKLPDTAGVASSDAVFGNEVHGLLSHGVSEMTASERASWVANKCQTIQLKLANKILGPSYSIFTETRFWIHDHAGSKIFSAKLDWVGAISGKILICDYKSLHGVTDRASENYQLLGQALAFADDDETRNKNGEIEVNEMFVAIIQPAVELKPEVCRYSVEDLIRAKKLILQKIDESKTIGAPRIPGLHCKWCPCSSVCPESAADLMATEKRHNLSIDHLTPQMVANILPMLPSLKKRVKDFEAHAKELAEKGELPGYEIKTQEGNRYIQSHEYVQGVRNVLSDYIAKDDILPLLSLPFGELREIFIERCVSKDRCDKVAAGKLFDELMEGKCQREKPKKLLAKSKS